MSSVLVNPNGVSTIVDTVSKQLLLDNFDRIYEEQTEFGKIVDELRQKIEKLKSFGKISRDGLNGVMFRYTTQINSIANDPSQRVLYTQLTDAIIDKKNLQALSITIMVFREINFIYPQMVAIFSLAHWIPQEH